MDEVSNFCDNCASEVEIGPAGHALKCKVCGFENFASGEPDAAIQRPDFMLPLAIDEKQLRAALATHMASGQMTPDDLISSAEIIQCEVFYAPAYAFYGKFDAQWTASFGYTRREEFTVVRDVYDSNLGRKIKTPVTETRKVIDWRPASGLASGSFNIRCYSGPDKSTGVRDVISRMPLDGLKKISGSFSGGLRLQEAVVTSKKLFADTGATKLREVIAKSVKGHAQGDKQKDWAWSVKLDKKTRSIAVPVGIIRYSYKQKEYTFWLDGTGSGNFWADNLPIDKGRLLTISLSYLPFALAGGSFFLVDSSAKFFVGMASILFGALGVFRHWAIADFSRKRRAAAATQIVGLEQATNPEFGGASGESTHVHLDLKPSFLGRTVLDKLSIPIASTVAILVAWFPSLLSTINLAGDPATEHGSMREKTPESNLKAGRISDIPVETSASLRSEIEPRMVILPPGSFTMGAPQTDGWDDILSGPQQTVRIDYGLAVGKYEITVAQYKVFASETGWSVRNGCLELDQGRYREEPLANWQRPGFTQTDEHPVTCVSWHDAQGYIDWLNHKTGLTGRKDRYRLLTEAEWEYAARAGTQTTYSFGDEEQHGCNYMNGAGGETQSRLSDLGNTLCKDGYTYTAPVGTFRANPFGLHDMHGNVFEWVQDCFVVGYDGAPSDGSSRVDGDCSVRVTRGGSWMDLGEVLASFSRSANEATDSVNLVGFRVARTIKP